MSTVTSDPAADLLAPIKNCEACWGLIACPNPVAGVIVNTAAPGFMPGCEIHLDGFRADYPTATVVYMTVAEFDAHRAEYIDPAHPGRRA